MNLNVLIRRDKAGGEYGDHVWKVVQLTGNKHSHSTIATMPIQNDGGWHHGQYKTLNPNPESPNPKP